MRSWRFLPAKTAANFDWAGGAGGRLGSVEGDTFSGMDVEKQRLQTAEAILVESTLNQREQVFVHKSFFDDECSREGSEPFRQLPQGPSDRPVRNRSAILQKLPHYRAALSKGFRNLVAIRACVVRAALQSMNSSLARIFASLVNSKQVLPSTEVTFKSQALRDLVA